MNVIRVNYHPGGLPPGKVDQRYLRTITKGGSSYHEYTWQELYGKLSKSAGTNA